LDKSALEKLNLEDFKKIADGGKTAVQKYFQKLEDKKGASNFKQVFPQLVKFAKRFVGANELRQISVKTFFEKKSLFNFQPQNSQKVFSKKKGTYPLKTENETPNFFEINPDFLKKWKTPQLKKIAKEMVKEIYGEIAAPRVWRVQTFLRREGIRDYQGREIAVDGKIGNRTYSALLLAEPDLRAKLKKIISDPEKEIKNQDFTIISEIAELPKDRIRAIQEILKRQGVLDKNNNPIAADGFFGKLTGSAIHRLISNDFAPHAGVETLTRIRLQILQALVEKRVAEKAPGNSYAGIETVADFFSSAVDSDGDGGGVDSPGNFRTGPGGETGSPEKSEEEILTELSLILQPVDIFNSTLKNPENKLFKIKNPTDLKLPELVEKLLQIRPGEESG
jgi:hypothetical protein